jgi:hypothetical protein
MSTIKLFETSQVRSQWDAEKEAWFFSIVDVIAVLTDSPKARTYWSVLKNRLKKEGSELATNCSQLKMQSADGKNYLTDVADTEQLLRLIQSIPSPKAEPFKQWLARVGYERIEETDDPELAFDRAMATYLKKGYSKAWSGLSTRQYRQNKDLKKESLRDHMTHDQHGTGAEHVGRSHHHRNIARKVLRVMPLGGKTIFWSQPQKKQKSKAKIVYK